MTIIKKIILPIIILIILSSSVLGISLKSSPFTPNPKLFEPKLTITKSYTMSSYNYDAQPYLSGDLAEYAKIINIQDQGNSKSFLIILTLPDSIDKPGIHNLLIGATEIAPEGAGGITALARVQKEIRIMVLFDEVAAKFYSLNTPNINENEESKISFTAESITKQNIKNLWAEIKIFDYNKNLIKTLKTETFDLKSAEKKTITTTFNSKGLTPGKFFAEAKIYWANKTTELKNEFNVGTLTMEIVNVSTNLTAGKINKIKLITKSNWNGDIRNVFAQLLINDEEQTATQSYFFKPFEEKEIIGYLDLTYLKKGDYNLTIILNFENEKITLKKVVEIKGEAKRKPFNINFNSTEIMMILVIVVLILLIIIILQQRKKK